MERLKKTPDGLYVDGRKFSTLAGEEFPWFYFSTTGTSTGNCTDPSFPCPLGLPVVITQDKTITLWFNADNLIQANLIGCLLGVNMGVR